MSKKVSIFAVLKNNGVIPYNARFVYRLGRKIFILERRVRFSYRVQIFLIIGFNCLTSEGKEIFSRIFLLKYLEI